MVTIWYPENLAVDKPLYTAIADALAEDIFSGKLAADVRLPPIRKLASSLGVTTGTINRAYNLAEKRGLIVSETGRGSFVKAPGQTPHVPLVLPQYSRGTGCNLTLNAPVFVELENYLSGSLSTISKTGNLDNLLQYGDTRGPDYHRKIIARWLKNRGLNTVDSEMLITGGGQQGLAIVLSALTQAGDSVLVEELTYSGAKNFARLHGLNLIPVKMDKYGLRPDDLEKKLAASGTRTLICMPSQHNPTSRTMNLERRQLIAQIAVKHRLLVIEDDVYLRDKETAELPTLQKLLPKQTFHVTGFSKFLAPGLRVGAIISPADNLSDLVNAAQTNSWMPPAIMSEIVTHWIECGLADEIVAQRTQVTSERILLARNILNGLRIESSEAATHIWLSLRHPWKADTFSHDLTQQGISITPSDYFSTDPSKEFAAVRIAVGLPTSLGQLTSALKVIAKTAKCPPGSLTFGF